MPLLCRHLSYLLTDTFLLKKRVFLFFCKIVDPVKATINKPAPVRTEAEKKPVESGKGSISSMFAKQSSKPMPVKTAAEEKENIVNQRIEEKPTEGQEKKEKTKHMAQFKTKSNKAKANTKEVDTKKRKRIQVMSGSESEEEDHDEEDDKKDKEDAKETPPPVFKLSAVKLTESDDEIPASPVHETR